MRNTASYVLPLFVGLALATAGCSHGSTAGTVSVSGTVTFKGQPVPKATVTFIGEGDARTAVAITDARGVYRLQTLDRAGAMPGKYVAVVSKAESIAEDDRPISMDEAAKNLGKAREPKQLLPAKYADPSRSPLKLEVKAGRTNTIDLQLEG